MFISYKHRIKGEQISLGLFESVKVIFAFYRPNVTINI